MLRKQNMRTTRLHHCASILFLAAPFIPCASHAQDANRSISATRPVYIPLTQSERNKLYVRALISPISFVESAASAGWGQLRNKPPEWGEGGAAYGERFASSVAQHVTGESIKFGLSSLLHEDNRYVASGKAGIAPRVFYALVSTFRSRDDEGNRQVSYSNIGSMVGASMLSRTWQPDSGGGPGNGAVNFGVSVAFSAGMNVVHEFLHR
jgi:hypothetical protein